MKLARVVLLAFAITCSVPAVAAETKPGVWRETIQLTNLVGKSATLHRVHDYCTVSHIDAMSDSLMEMQALLNSAGDCTPRNDKVSATTRAVRFFCKGGVTGGVLTRQPDSEHYSFDAWHRLPHEKNAKDFEAIGNARWIKASDCRSEPQVKLEKVATK